MSVLAVALALAALILAILAMDRAAAATRRARALEDEIARLRAERDDLATTPPEAVEASTPPTASEPAPITLEDEGEDRVATDEEPAPPPVVEPPRGVEATIGLTWATRVGGALLLAGVIFFFKYAVDRDWLGPWARVGLGAAAGVGAIALAARLRGRASRTWVDILAGVGLAILLVVAWASHALYGLVPPGAAFAAFLVLVLAGGGLAVAFDSEPLLVTAALAGLANPILLGEAVGSEPLRFAYVDVIAATTLVVATPRRWGLAAFAAGLGGLAVGVAWWLARGGGVPAELEWTALIGTLALSAVVMVAALRWREATLRAPLLAVGAAVLIVGSTALVPRGADVALMAALAGAALVLALARRVADTDWASLAGLAVTAAAVVIRGAPTDVTSIALLGVMATVYLADATVALGRRDGPANVSEHLLWQLVLAGGAFTALTIHGLGLEPEARGALAAAATGMTVAYAASGAWLLSRGRRIGASTALHVALAFLAAVAPLVLSGVAVLAAWSALGAAMALLAGRARLPRLEIGALVVLGLAILHVAVVDWPAPTFDRLEFLRSGGAHGAFFAPQLIGDRTLSLLLTGVALLLFAFAGRGTPWRRLGAVVRFGGLAAIGLALAAEAALTVDRAAIDGPVLTASDGASAALVLEGLASLRGLATTLALGAWGAAVLIWGFARRDVHARWFGLGLLAAVVLKVLALDLWDFDPVARTIILVAFGVLLLASGFLYARFGERLRGLLREDE